MNAKLYQDGDRAVTNCRRYVLITPARNEEGTVARTIAAVLKQTILPVEWVIVNDGSTDRTGAIINEAAALHQWIRPIHLSPREKPCFAVVVVNTTLGIQSLSTTDYDYIGLLDADIEFQTDYYERLMKEFHRNPKLGLAGGVAVDIGHPRELPRNRIDIPGALQFFRKECFDKLGGLVAIPEGGWDSLTCAMARMNGYETKLVTDLIVDHLKPRNITQGGALKRKWQMGVRDNALGYHPLFEFVKCSSRIRRERPFLIGSMAWFLGFCVSYIRRPERVVPRPVVRYIRKEQVDRLLKAVKVWSR